MTDSSRASSAFVAQAESAEQVERTRAALNRAGIPHRTALLQEDPPRILFSVPESRRLEAEFVLGLRPTAGRAAPPSTAPVLETTELPPVAGAEALPSRLLALAAFPVIVHLLLVAWTQSDLPGGREAFAATALIVGNTLLEPWRLLTSMWMHSGPSHVLWNGVSLIVFAVPLLQLLGERRTALLYLASGVGGSLAAVGVGAPGTWIVGSSGAVAGLFGGWLATRLQFSGLADLESRERIRIVGIGLLVLPAFLNPSTATGRPISVSSHVGGLVTGLAIGLWLTSRMLGTRTAPSGSESVRESPPPPDPAIH